MKSKDYVRSIDYAYNTRRPKRHINNAQKSFLIKIRFYDFCFFVTCKAYGYKINVEIIIFHNIVQIALFLVEKYYESVRNIHRETAVETIVHNIIIFYFFRKYILN